jgi:hypothetical protein
MRQAPRLRFGDPKPVLSATGTRDTVTLANTQRTIFRDGFSAIAPLDTNRDGRIDASDGAVSGWSIRRDLNGDGSIGANETRLAQASDLRIWRDFGAPKTAAPAALSCGLSHFAWSDGSLLWA